MRHAALEVLVLYYYQTLLKIDFTPFLTFLKLVNAEFYKRRLNDYIEKVLFLRLISKTSQQNQEHTVDPDILCQNESCHKLYANKRQGLSQR